MIIARIAEITMIKGHTNLHTRVQMYDRLGLGVRMTFTSRISTKAYVGESKKIDERNAAYGYSNTSVDIPNGVKLNPGIDNCCNISHHSG
jgi:hypothetical protein